MPRRLGGVPNTTTTLVEYIALLVPGGCCAEKSEGTESSESPDTSALELQIPIPGGKIILCRVCDVSIRTHFEGRLVILLVGVRTSKSRASTASRPLAREQARQKIE